MKKVQGTKHSGLFCLNVSSEDKKFYNNDAIVISSTCRLVNSHKLFRDGLGTKNAG